MTPVVTAWARSDATDVRILVSALLLAPPAFCMGMMFPLGLSLWRRHSELLPFFWSANGVTSTLASVLGMALSIEFGIARTYALGVSFYVVCALMIVGSRKANFAGVSAAGPRQGMAAGGPRRTRQIESELSHRVNSEVAQPPPFGIAPHPARSASARIPLRKGPCHLGRAGAARAEAVYQAADTPNDVTVTHEFASVKEAEAFVASEELKKAM